jgi:hypothetical protein
MSCELWNRLHCQSFFYVIELQSATANGIFQALLDCLQLNGIKKPF